MECDSTWMQIALSEARKAEGCTSPNPLVGAVIVRDGKELGRGFHSQAGQWHAEREAIANARERFDMSVLKGATLYVTLEPCSTEGRTPSCTSAILEAGISKVIYGSMDPNPAHVGAADRLLKEHGIEVKSGVEQLACDRLLRPFRKSMTTGLPWVIGKTAMSLDGKITRPPGESQWLTSEKSREIVQHLRLRADAIVVGGRTVRKDNPRLTLRGIDIPKNKQQPYRVVLTNRSRANLPKDAHLFSDTYADRTLVYEDKPMLEVLKSLTELGCQTVLLECGGRLMGEFVDQDLIDEYAIFYAPLVTGGSDTGFAGHGVQKADIATKLEEISYTKIDNDVLVQGIVKRYTS